MGQPSCSDDDADEPDDVGLEETPPLFRSPAFPLAPGTGNSGPTRVGWLLLLLLF